MADPKIYTVGWICAITTEAVAAQAFLDEEHEEPLASAQNDNNVYTRGKMANHNVVIAVLPKWEYGIAPAATVARDMVRTFPNIRIGLMVGVGGGVPSHKHDIRLGDVVIASRDQSIGGVFQYDYGRRIQDQPFETTGFLNQPPQLLLAAVASLEAKYTRKGHQLNDAMDRALEQWPRLRRSHSRPPANHDRLFKSSITHPLGSSGDCSREKCDADPANLVSRHERGEDEDNPAIHYGLMASANQLMKDAEERDLLAKKGVLCFEMEAAGLMNHFPCLVVRGICDYSDTHKNQDWQGFAAMVAAAYAKDLLRQIAPDQVEKETRLADILEKIEVNQTQQLQTMNKTKAAVEAMRSDGHVAKIKNWLSPPDTSTNSNDARKSRHEGTGAWFLESAAFRGWKLGSRTHLWLHGMPGSGKTVLSTTILDHLAQMNDRVTLDFFFDFRDTDKQKPDDMCRSLAFQLYSQRLESRRVLDDLLASHDNGRKQPAAQELSKCLQAMIQVAGKLCIVLDALDECVKRTEILEWMQDFISSPDVANVQFLVTGRPEEEFVRGLRSWVREDNCISLENESVNADISSYIGARLQQSEEFKKWAPKEDEKGEIDDVPQMIQDKVGGKANGMFRWAACQLDSLEICRDLEELENALETLPQDLNATYDRMLKKTEEKGVRLLQLLVHSQRPLTLQEAVDAIAVRVKDKQCFKPKDRLRRPTQITTFCPSLVDLIEAPGTARAEGTLQLAHFTVKEYLLQSDKEGFRGNEAHVSITKTCLFYLRSVEEDELHQMRTRFPLARYAAEIWMDNAGPAESSEDVVALIVNFLQSSTGFRVWARLFDPERAWDTDPGLPKASSLYYACLNGLAGTVGKLLSKMPDVNTQGGRFGNALQAASSEGYTEIVRMLVENNAAVNAQGGEYSNALQAASHRGHTEIVRMLLQNNADINAHGGRFGNALQAASSEGHTEIVRMLLENNADVNVQGSEYGNALQAASSEGHAEIVQMLLENNADVNAQGGEYSNALQAASSVGHTEIIQMLLENNAEINAQGGKYSNALQAASSEGHTEIIQILLQNNADVNVQGSKYSNALQAASSKGHTEIIRMLLENNVDVNAQSGEYSNALQAASHRGHTEIVWMLLQNNTDVNSQGGRFSNALQAASSKGHTEIVRMLLENNADVKTQDSDYTNTLYDASSEGYTEIVRMLLENNVDVNAQSSEYGNALQAASSEGHTEIVRMLLENNTDVNAQGGLYSNALQAASHRGRTEIVWMLLENNADVNVQGGLYSNALQAASHRGRTDIVWILLENNADVNAQGGLYGNALQAASSEGHTEIVRMLLQYNADVNAQGGLYGNALQAASHRGRTEILRMLLENNADFNAQGGEYDGPTRSHPKRRKFNADQPIPAVPVIDLKALPDPPNRTSVSL